VREHLSAASRDALQALDDAIEPLDRLAGIRGVIAALDSDPATLAAVRAARDAGASWDDIARSAGLGVAAAKWRWQGTDAEIAQRHDAGRQRAKRPSSRPTDLPGLSVAEAADRLGISVQGIYQRVARGQLESRTVVLDDGRSYKRVFPE
jgi:hypothetical protein